MLGGGKCYCGSLQNRSVVSRKYRKIKQPQVPSLMLEEVGGLVTLRRVNWGLIPAPLGSLL